MLAELSPVRIARQVPRPCAWHQPYPSVTTTDVDRGLRTCGLDSGCTATLRVEPCNSGFLAPVETRCVWQTPCGRSRWATGARRGRDQGTRHGRVDPRAAGRRRVRLLPRLAGRASPAAVHTADQITGFYSLDAFASLLEADIRELDGGDPGSFSIRAENVVEQQLSGVYRPFIRLVSPGSLVKRIAAAHRAYFRGVEVVVLSCVRGHATVRYGGFRRGHRTLEYAIRSFFKRGLQLTERQATRLAKARGAPAARADRRGPLSPSACGRRPTADRGRGGGSRAGENGGAPPRHAPRPAVGGWIRRPSFFATAGGLEIRQQVRPIRAWSQPQPRPVSWSSRSPLRRQRPIPSMPWPGGARCSPT